MATPSTTASVSASAERMSSAETTAHTANDASRVVWLAGGHQVQSVWDRGGEVLGEALPGLVRVDGVEYRGDVDRVVQYLHREHLRLAQARRRTQHVKSMLQARFFGCCCREFYFQRASKPVSMYHRPREGE